MDARRDDAMTEEEKSNFTVVDKRRVKEDADAVATESQPTSPPPPEEEPTTQSSQHLPRLTMRDRLLMCIDILHQGAWISMGLIADPATGQIEKDMAAAKTAIDSVEFLASKVEGELDEETRREIRRLISDLQVNFVQQMSR